jgi:hypothetical protein
LAHELTHVVQQGRFDNPENAIQRQPALAEESPKRPAPTPGAKRARSRRPPRAFVALPPLEDAELAFPTLIERLHTNVLPNLQKAIDEIEQSGIKGAGQELLALWSMIEGSHAALALPGSDLTAYTEARSAVLAMLGPQTFRGERLLGESSDEPPRLQVDGDLGPLIHQQVTDMAEVAADGQALVTILRRVPTDGLTQEEQWQAVGLLRRHPNPWHTAYMRAATRACGVDDAFNYAFWDSALRGLQLTWAAAEWLRQQGRAGPGEAIGILELLPRDRMVRLLQPQSPKDLAVELYGQEAVGLQLLTGYNRAVVSEAGPEGWIAAGTTLAVDPGLLSGVYATVFQAAMKVRERLDRPYLEAQPEGAAVTGTTGRYVVHWAEPPPPPGALRLNTGEPLFGSLRSRVKRVTLTWWVEHDPAVVAAGVMPAYENLGQTTIEVDKLGTDEAKAEYRLRAAGTHLVRCNVTLEPETDYDRFFFEDMLGERHVELRHPQAVTTLKEVTDIEWLRVKDPRKISLLFIPEGFAEAMWSREVYAGLSITPPAADQAAEGTTAEEGREEQFLRGDPRGLLASLRKLRETMPEGDRRDAVDKQIKVLDEAIQKAGPGGMRPIDSIYVSSEDHAATIPLAIYVGYDPESNWPTDLCLWDFTLAGPPRIYRSHGSSLLRDSLRDLLEEFADDAPYPSGNIRFAVGPWSLPGDDPSLVSETFTFETDGGMVIDDVLRALSMAALGVAVLAAAFLQPEIAIPAFYVSGVLGGAAGAVSIYDRLEHGDFEWDLQTGMDLLDVAGAVTLGIGTAFGVSARGVGGMTMIGRIQRGLDVVQIGVLAGTHVAQIGAAAASGDQKKLAEALLHALGDGALYLVVHKASARAAEVQATRRPDFPVRAEGPGVLPAPVRVDVPTSQPAPTARGTTRGGGGEMGGPADIASARPGTPEYHRARHDAWVQGLREGGLAPREPAPTSGGAPVREGTFRDGITDPDTALASYDEALSRAGGREVGIFRNVETGEYAVRVGDEHGLRAPVRGNWETVLHRHPNPENVLTRRLPAPQDVEQAVFEAFRGGRRRTEFIEFEYPDGRRGRSAYTVDPARKKISIEWERPDGTRVQREFGSLREYAEFYGERTTYVDPKSAEYEWIMRDLADFYSSLPVSGLTARGAARGVPPGEPRLALDVPERLGAPESVPQPKVEPKAGEPVQPLVPAKVAEPGPGLKDKMSSLQKQRVDLEQELRDTLAKEKELSDTVLKEHQAVRTQLDLETKAPPEKKAELRQKAREANERKKAAQRDLDKLRSPSELTQEIQRIQNAIERTDILLNPKEHRAALPCFSGDTPVWTADGSRPIEQLRAGDIVLAFDFERNCPVERAVLEIFRNRTRHFYDIAVGGGVIHATGRHRFWEVNEGGWIAAGDLREGMCLRVHDGRPAAVDAVALREDLDSETFNLAIEGVSNYFVGAGVLVHNQGTDIGLGGNYIIYRGTNKAFPGKVYIGQTTLIDADGKPRGSATRQGEHRDFANTQLRAHAEGTIALTPDQQEFYRFMSEVDLEPIVRGIDTKDQADYLEQRNMDIERKLNGEESLMNRREQIASEAHLTEVTTRILNDSKVQAAGYCPK